MGTMLGRRRARWGGAEIEEVESDGIEIPDDAVVAMQLLRTQFPVVGMPPVALVSQIYSLVKDRTSVDRQLDKAVRRQELRLFRSGPPCRQSPLSVSFSPTRPGRACALGLLAGCRETPRTTSPCTWTTLQELRTRLLLRTFLGLAAICGQRAPLRGGKWLPRLVVLAESDGTRRGCMQPQWAASGARLLQTCPNLGRMRLK